MTRWFVSLCLVLGIACSIGVSQSSQSSILFNRVDFQYPWNIQNNGNYLSGVILGDFNGDGNSDFVFGSYSSSGNPILNTGLGSGNGTFLSVAQTALPSTIFVNPYQTRGVSGDFNGDKKQDVIVLGYVQDQVLRSMKFVGYYFAGNGDGTFGQPVPIINNNVGVDENLGPIQVADFNHDGRPDLIVCRGNGDLAIYLGNGNGTFQAPIVTQTGITSGTGVFSVGDVNNDGYPDLLVFDTYYYYYSSFVPSILLGKGDGTFAAPAPLSQLPTLQNENRTFFLADLNGDGKLDILADIGGGSQILSLAGNGDGTFGQPVSALPAGPQVIESGSPGSALLDLNGDGKPDLILATSTGMSWAQGNGNGTFGSLTLITSDQVGGIWPVRLSSMTSGLITVGGPGALYLPTTSPNAFEISAPALNFGSLVVGSDLTENYGGQPLVVTNRGTSVLTLSSATTQAPFQLLNGCSQTLAVGQSCEISTEFVPVQTGSANGTLTIANNSAISPLQIALTGNGVTPTFSMQPTSITFPDQKVGTLSAPQTITVTNLTATPQSPELYNLQSLYLSGFVETDDCRSPLITTCTISIQYAPQTVGSTSAFVSILDVNGASVMASVTATGFVVGPQVTITPGSLDFGKPFVGTSSSPQTVTLTNSGDAPVSISSVATGTGFTALNACGSNVAPGASCEIGIFMDTSATGTKSASLTITDNAPNSPQTIALTGNVTSVSVAAASGSSTSQTLSGGTATYSLVVNPTSGYAGSLAVGCANVPSGFTCSPSVSNLTLDGKNPASVSITVKNSTSAAVQQGSRLGIFSTAVSLSSVILLVPIAFRRRNRWLAVLPLCVLFLSVGCSGGSTAGNSPANPTPTPTTKSYVLNATFTASNGGAVQVPLTLTVQQ